MLLGSINNAATPNVPKIKVIEFQNIFLFNQNKFVHSTKYIFIISLFSWYQNTFSFNLLTNLYSVYFIHFLHSNTIFLLLEFFIQYFSSEYIWSPLISTTSEFLSAEILSACKLNISRRA